MGYNRASAARKCHMPPLVLFLLVAGGAALVSSSKKAKRINIRFPRGHGRAVSIFADSTPEEYPAPYRLADAEILVDLLIQWGATPSNLRGDPNLLPYVTLLDKYRHEILHSTALPNWRKVYGLIYTVAIPALASGVCWEWFRTPNRSQLKTDRYNAIASWAAMFCNGSVTATAPPSIRVDRANSSLLSGIDSYLDPNTPLRRGELSPAEIRRVIYDVFSWSRLWNARNWDFYMGRGRSYFTPYAESEELQRLADAAANRMAELHRAFPVTQKTNFVLDGNAKAAVELIALYNNEVLIEYAGPDIDQGLVGLGIALQVIGALVKAIPAVGGAVGAAIAQGAQAAMAAVSAVTALVANGGITQAQFQAMVSSGVATLLEETGIRLPGVNEALAELRG